MATTTKARLCNAGIHPRPIGHSARAECLDCAYAAGVSDRAVQPGEDPAAYRSAREKELNVLPLPRDFLMVSRRGEITKFSAGPTKRLARGLRRR